MNRGEGVAAVIWGGCAGLVLSLAAACGDKEQHAASGDEGGFYDGDGGGAGDGADSADGTTDGAEGADDGDGATDGGLDEGGGTTGGGSGTVDGASDDGWDGGTDGGGDGSPTPVWVPDLSVSCEGALDFQLHVIDIGATPCVDDCDAGEIWLGGAIFNPCDEPLSVSLDGGMVISGGSYVGPDGRGTGWASGSDGTVTTVEIAPGGFIQGTESLGALSAGDWAFSINFGDADRHSLEADRTLR